MGVIGGQVGSVAGIREANRLCREVGEVWEGLVESWGLLRSVEGLREIEGCSLLHLPGPGDNFSPLSPHPQMKNTSPLTNLVPVLPTPLPTGT